ncbi:MAG: HAD family hydrolase [Cyanobacteria bacterium P01_H01_bin.21]
MATVFCNGKRFVDVNAVFLDKDGTLADVANYLQQLGHIQAQLMEQAIPGVNNIVLKTLGIDSGRLAASGLLAVGSRQETVLGTAAAAAMLGQPWVEAIELAATTLAAADQKCFPKATYTPLLPGVLELLKRLRQVNLKIIMVSADSQDNLEQFVEYHQLHPYFDKLQGSSYQHPDKTAPEFLLAACQAVGLSPHQGIVIGDSASDLRMAKSACGFIGYLGGWQPTLTTTDILGSTNSSPSMACRFVKDFSQITLIP